MRLNEKQVSKKIINYLQDLGCTVVKQDVREKNSIVDIIAYTINEEGDMEPQVAVEITKDANPNKQRQLFTYAKRFDTKYALFVITGDEIQKYWFNGQNGLPIPEPSFESYSRFLIRKEDIERKLFEIIDIISGLALRSFEKVRLIKYILLIRSYLENIDELDKWDSLNLSGLIKYFELAKDYYGLEIDDLKIQEIEEVINQIIHNFSALPPIDENYSSIFISLLERSSSRDTGQFSTTENLVNIVSEITKNLPIKEGNVIDLSLGFGFLLMNVMKKLDLDDYYGIEINKEISQLSKILNIISGQKKLIVLSEDALKHEKNNHYNLTIVDPPLGANISRGYDEFKVSKGGKRKNVKASELFIEKAINVTKKDGYIVAVVPEGVLFTSPSKIIRELIKEQTIVKAIISLPSHILKPYIGVKVSIVVLKKKVDSNEQGKEFFVGKIESLEDSQEVIEAFGSWIGKGE